MTDTSKEAVELLIAHGLTDMARSKGLPITEDDVDTCKATAATLRAQAARIAELEARLATSITMDLHQQILVASRDTVLQEAANEARRFSESYKQGSDGRNTFIILAELLESRRTKENT